MGCQQDVRSIYLSGHLVDPLTGVLDFGGELRFEETVSVGPHCGANGDAAKEVA